jgi:hypothetical protein
VPARSFTSVKPTAPANFSPQQVEALGEVYGLLLDLGRRRRAREALLALLRRRLADLSALEAKANERQE